MGGSINGIGNVTSCGEFNVWHDSQAAHMVTQNFGLNSIWVTLDTTLNVPIPHEFFLHVLPAVGEHCHVSQAVLKMSEQYTKVAGKPNEGDGDMFLKVGSVQHDSICFLLSIFPDLFTVNPTHMLVQHQGGPANGMTVFDRRDKAVGVHEEDNINVVTDSNHEGIIRSFLQCFKTTIKTLSPQIPDADLQKLSF
eukprot:TRINITY_DN4874_c0_g1_i1.p1 TRINITY_DN4874_c0_g1~~TRINITY_DN4874_c0_g1_i1.p1  ORF type:complete len:194 (+),score=27.15 TRINITY_DN4874_c0_g1_i1:150-731(+)